MKICSTPLCQTRAVANGLCMKHYMRERRAFAAQWVEPLRPKKRAIGEDYAARLAWIARNAFHTDKEACLVWPFHVPATGRPNVGRVSAPRVMCEVAHGPPPNAHACVLHSCGNGHLGCLNPNHLRWGSHLENSADSLRHKRHGKKGL